MDKEYQKFLQSKKHLIGNFGFKAKFIPDCAFDFQAHVIEKSVYKGRIANFLDTGLGKTLIQISIARNIIEHTNKRVVIFTPLAVGFQFMIEAELRQITDDIYQTKKGETNGKKIILCNYERLHYLNPKDYVCAIGDESSILKNFDGKIKAQFNSFVKKIKYRFLATATPSPNDFIELGTSSEALGYMGYMDMLTKFFKNNQNSVDSSNRNIGEKYYLKPHAEKDFFAWVNQWSIMCKMPSDLGFSNDGYVLPELITNDHVVSNQSLIDVNGQVQMFTPIAKSMTEVKHEQVQTIKPRCEKAFELSSGKTSVYWVNFNEESRLLNEIDKEAVEIKGSMSLDKKEEILLGFANGDFERLITKASMTSMGLNWQHCNHSSVFPTWSYEQWYQLIRRFWRFGQENDVTIDRITSDGQTRVIQALDQKTLKAIQLYTNLTANVNADFSHVKKEFNQKIILPQW